MQKQRLLLVLVLFLSVFLYSGTAQHKRVIIGKKTVKKDGINSEIRNLAMTIVDQYRTDNQKALAIYKWLATNIPYDYELRFDKQLQKEIYTSEANVIRHVLKREKALCGGYAYLFKALCDEAGIETKVIHGYSKKYGMPQSDTIDHTWNAVRIENEWQLLDITYARGAIRSHKDVLLWYNCIPSEFIRTHYPEDAEWSLLKNTKPRSHYVSL